MRRKIAVTASLVVLPLVGASPFAEASTDAVGGGCSSIIYTVAGYGNGCIGASAPGVAVPNAYYTAGAGHPACTLLIEGRRASDNAVLTRRTVACPAGPVHTNIAAPAIHASSGSYYTYYQIGNLAGVRSPAIRLP